LKDKSFKKKGSFRKAKAMVIKMKIRKLIELIDSLRPNAYGDEVKYMWINEVEGLVQSEVMLLASPDFVNYSCPEDIDAELLAEPPHEKIYPAYLAAMIDFANGEYNKYANSLTMFNSYFSEYMRWYARTMNPGGENAGFLGYYLSAYAIAVKHGYVGSEAEWVASLKGEKGERGNSVTIRGVYSSESELVLAVSGGEITPLVGDAYGVGGEEDYHAYIYLGSESGTPRFIDWGDLRGIKGDKGDKGEDGKDGKYVSKAEIIDNPGTGYGELWITITDPESGRTTITNLGRVVGRNGEDGTDGSSVTAAEIKNGRLYLTIYYPENGTSAVLDLGNVKGEKGDTYTLSTADKQEIASMIAFVQPDEPSGADDNALWIDTDEEGLSIPRAEEVGF